MTIQLSVETSKLIALALRSYIERNDCTLTTTDNMCEQCKRVRLENTSLDTIAATIERGFRVKLHSKHSLAENV